MHLAGRIAIRSLWVPILASVAACAPARRTELGPGPRSGHNFVYDRTNSRALLLFGYTGQERPPRPEIWAWSGSQWSVVDRIGPGFRTLAGVAIDDSNSALLLFGGAGPAYQTRFGDTWRWRDGAWTQLALSSPGPTDHHAVAYDARHRTLLSVGGNDPAGGWVGGTWALDSAGWRLVADTLNSPPHRAHHAMVYDERRGRVVLFGGLARDRAYLNDTWEWDGARWTRMEVPAPSARTRHRMAYDAARGVIVLYGGSGVRPAGQTTGFNVLSDVWEYDGSSWREIAAPTGPGKRFMHAMTFDIARGETLVFGGSDGAATFDDLWAWNGVAWQKK